MEQVLIDYLNNFEQRLRKQLLETLTGKGVLKGKFLESDDINQYWHTIEPNYISDAVTQIAQYPTVSVAWAMYLGMAVAYCWDADWATYSNAQYENFYGSDGFDNMDDHIVRDILQIPLNCDEAKLLTALVQSLAQQTVTAVRHEQIEPQSKMAFYVFDRACSAMFSVGAAIELQKLGYKFEKRN